MLESQIIANEKLPNVHPGEVLKEEFLVPLNLSAYSLAKFFGTTAEFWLNLQNLYDLEEENNHAKEFEMIKMYAYA